MAIASWLTPAAKSGTGNKTIGLTASKNTGASRTTIVTVSVSGITKLLIVLKRKLISLLLRFQL